MHHVKQADTEKYFEPNLYSLHSSIYIYTHDTWLNTNILRLSASYESYKLYVK
jgi:hypothetical protein